MHRVIAYLLWKVQHNDK